MHTNAGWADDGSKHMQLNRNKLVKMAANMFTWSQVKSALHYENIDHAEKKRSK